MSGTTIGPVKAALATLWAASFAGNPEVQVGHSGRATTSRAQRIVVGDIEGDSQPETAGPQRTMQEVYDVRCLVSATSNGSVDDQQRVTELVISMYLQAEAAVRAVPSQNLGVAGVIWAGVEGSWSLTEATAAETGGPISTSIEFRVHVTAIYRLT